MRKRQYRFFLILAIIIFTAICAAVYYVNDWSNVYIPSEIRLVVGKEEYFDYNVPLNADILPEKQGVLTVNDNKVPGDKIVVNLNNSFKLSSSETGEFDVTLKLFGLIPIKTVKVNVIDEKELIPCGLTVGIVVDSDGVMVLGTGTVYGEDGNSYEPAVGKLYSGDYIVKVNNIDINSKEELAEIIMNNNGEEIVFTVRRAGELVEETIVPVKTNEADDYKIGIWVRDDTQGIGTLTYINPEDLSFGALGHGISDSDTEQLIEVSEGNIMNAQISEITKGQNGSPGEISGIIINDTQNIYGDVSLNTPYGIFGTASEKLLDIVDIQPMAIGYKHEIKEGPAVIYCSVDGKVKEYDIEITKIYLGSGELNKGMVIEVVDEELLDLTNGIVQGMSGSPIIQNEKIIGAVTHVFVQDSTKGYATFIENMLNSDLK